MKKGRVISVAVRKGELKEGMQVLIPVVYAYDLVSQNETPKGRIQEKNGLALISRIEGGQVWTEQGWDISDLIDSLMVLVVEFVRKPYGKKIQVPLSYSQWKSVMKNGELDSNKEVEFNGKSVMGGDISDYYGKIIEKGKQINVAKIIRAKVGMYDAVNLKRVAKAAFLQGVSYGHCLGKGEAEFKEWWDGLVIGNKKSY